MSISSCLATISLNDSYQNIDPMYGDLADWDAIRDACHGVGMKVVMDLVVNHTSDQVSVYEMLIEWTRG